MKKYLIYLLAIVCVLGSSCKKDKHLTGGSTHDPKVNVSTYDYLKANPLFDTLVQLIDRAGLKEQVDGAVTFFAPTDYSIRDLMLRRTDTIQIRYNNENLKYTIDSFPVAELRDSLSAYLFDGSIERAGLSTNDKVFKNKVNEDFSVRLIETDSYTGVVSTAPLYVYLIRIRNGLDPQDNASVPLPDRDNRQLIQTSGILTTTGVLHVINNYHVFYWE